MAKSFLADFLKCAVLIIIGLALVYVWQTFSQEWILLAGGIVLLIFGIIAGVKAFFS